MLTQQRRQVYLLIDEFRRVAAHNVDTILQIARSMNVGVFLANQSMLDPARGEIHSRVWYSRATQQANQRCDQSLERASAMADVLLHC